VRTHSEVGVGQRRLFGGDRAPDRPDVKINKLCYRKDDRAMRLKMSALKVFECAYKI